MTDSANPTHPSVLTDADSQYFWTACAAGRLCGQRCAQCGLWRWPPREHCSRCHAAAPQWVEISGKGRVAGAAVLHRAFDPAFAADIPITLAHVEMDGTDQQMVLIGNLVPAISAARATGARVKVGFKSSPGGTFPVFQLSGESDDI